MNLAQTLAPFFERRFGVLILDNEVTVDAFVTDPPLPWVRLAAGTDGGYRMGEGYPSLLTAAEADREERNWDKVSIEAIATALAELDNTAALVAFGNNAGQGLPLAAALPSTLRGPKGVVMYGSSLPEQTHYESLGYRRFCPRIELLSAIGGAAGNRPPALAFINTIEHNEINYHAPWPGR
jgi:hypothetical protein